MGRIEGNRVILREYERDDLPYLMEWMNDESTIRNLSSMFMYPRSEEQALSWIEMCRKGFDQHSLHLVIGDKPKRSFLGQIDLLNIQWTNRSATLGIVLGPRAQGMGYGSDAITALLGFAFDQMNLRRIELEVFERNQRAITCYERCGFTHCGRRRQANYSDGEYQDVLLMDILQQEYEGRIKGNHAQNQDEGLRSDVLCSASTKD